jgi:hypothetical protein
MKPTAFLAALPALLVAAGVGFLLDGCSTTPPPGPKIDPALAGLIPGNTVMMAGIRIEALKRAPVYQKFQARRTLPQIDDFAKRTGVDPRKDLWELLYVSNGKSGALIGRGMFSDEGEPRLQKRGDNRFGYKGFNIVGSELTAILLVGQTVLALGDTDELRAIVDAHEKSAGPPPAMAPLLARIPAAAQVWAAYGGGQVQLPVDANGNLGNINKILSLIQTGTFYLDLSSGLAGVAEGTSTTEENAEQLESGLKALIGFGRLAVSPKQPQLNLVWDGLRPSRDHLEVKLHIDEPEETVDGLLDLLLGRAAK